MVDAPSGGARDNPPTRQMSIFTAATLARRSNAGAHVLVHDVHREIEDVFSNKFLCSENLVEALERSVNYSVVHDLPYVIITYSILTQMNFVKNSLSYSKLSLSQRCYEAT